MTAGAPIDFEASLLPVLGQAYGYALKLTRNPADAEDLVQEAVLQALRGLHTFKPGSPFKPWFFRILTNAHRMRWRTRARRILTISYDDAPELVLYNGTGAAAVPVTDDPAGALIGRMSQEAIERAIRALPVDYQEVAALYFSESLSYQEIAGILSIPVGTVRSRLHRARKRLQQLLLREAIDAGIAPATPPVVTPIPGLDPVLCAEAFSHIDDYVDRELSTEEMDRVRAHLELCALCSTEFAYEERLLDAVRAKIGRIDVPPAVRSAVAKRLAAPHVEHRGDSARAERHVGRQVIVISGALVV